MNFMKTSILLAGLTALFMGAGYLLGARDGMVIALAVAVVMNFFAYFNADKIVLRMYHAHPVDADSAPELYHLVESLAARARLPMPALYVMDNPQPNAFATGRNPQHAAVAVTTGLLERLSSEETAGVIAHELAHIKNRDTLTMTITATLAGAISMLANFAFFFRGGDRRDQPLGGLGAILVMLLAPLAAMLVQFAISRAREFEADRDGAAICGRPLWLASALQKIGATVPRILNQEAEHNPATAHLFIINPLHGGGIGNLFSTHPRLEDRIERLLAMNPAAMEGPEPPGPGFTAPARRPGPWG